MQLKFRTNDNKEYPLWSNIHEAVEIAMSYYSKTREKRQRRGWLFRGQANADWKLVPTLYRGDPDQHELDKRSQRTLDFIEALKRNAVQLGLDELTDNHLLAVAQHYGLPTNLLDFTYNLEVAAFFASIDNAAGNVGVIYCISHQRYQESADFLPPIVSDELIQVPRIFSQEGVFIQCTKRSTDVLHEECIDRFYFLQDRQRVYRGGSQSRSWILPSREDCDTEETYQAILNTVLEERPDLFERTPHMSQWRIFPLEDKIAQLAMQHPSPSPQAITEAKKDNQTIKSTWQKLMEDIEIGYVTSVDAVASLVIQSNELSEITERVSPETRGSIIETWKRLPELLIHDYVQPAFEQGVPARWIATLCESMVAAWSLDLVLKAEMTLESAQRTRRALEPFAARLWGMNEARVTEFDFETRRPNRAYFRSVIPLHTVATVIHRAMPEFLDDLDMDPGIKSDLLSFDEEQLLAGPYVQFCGMFSDRFLKFLDVEERWELWTSRVVPVAALFALNHNRPFLIPDEVYRCGFP